MNSLISSKLKNLSLNAKEKVEGFKTVPIKMDLFITLYSPIIEEIEWDKYTYMEKHIAGKNRLKNFIDKNYKGNFEIFERNIISSGTISSGIDYEWIKLQGIYAQNLPKRDIFTCCGYSYLGDTIINSYITGKFDIEKLRTELTPIYNEYNFGEFWKTRLFPFFAQIVDIIYRAIIMGKISESRIDESYQRIMKLKNT